MDILKKNKGCRDFLDSLKPACLAGFFFLFLTWMVQM
ncbi:hypothetical protein BSNT_08872 [Bacillus subtilis subsp. natto BEST195]|nr:hypothetical protein BSNT_08872 [Bacillus subtilis subsp. natto BEST195]